MISVIMSTQALGKSRVLHEGAFDSRRDVSVSVGDFAVGVPTLGAHFPAHPGAVLSITPAVFAIQMPFANIQLQRELRG